MGCGCGKKKNMPSRRAASRAALREAREKEAGMGIRGQSLPRQRVGGQWVYLDDEQNAEVAADAAEANNGDLSKLSRVELDDLATERGLDPTDFKNKPALIEALES